MFPNSFVHDGTNRQSDFKYCPACLKRATKARPVAGTGGLRAVQWRAVAARVCAESAHPGSAVHLEHAGNEVEEAAHLREAAARGPPSSRAIPCLARATTAPRTPPYSRALSRKSFSFYPGPRPVRLSLGSTSTPPCGLGSSNKSSSSSLEARHWMMTAKQRRETKATQ